MTIFTGISNIHESEIDLNGFYPVAAAAVLLMMMIKVVVHKVITVL